MYARSYCLTIASTRLRVSHGGFGSRPAKNMLYSASSCFSSTSRRFRSFSILGGGTIHSPRNEEPDERQPQLARIGHGTIVDENFGRGRSADDLEEIAEARRVARPEARAIALRGATARLAKLRRAARDVERLLELRILE